VASWGLASVLLKPTLLRIHFVHGAHKSALTGSFRLMFSDTVCAPASDVNAWRFDHLEEVWKGYVGGFDASVWWRNERGDLASKILHRGLWRIGSHGRAIPVGAYAMGVYRKH
jgi:hypothetical protein